MHRLLARKKILSLVEKTTKNSVWRLEIAGRRAFPPFELRVEPSAVDLREIPLNPPLEKGDSRTAPPFRKGGVGGFGILSIRQKTLIQQYWG